MGAREVVDQLRIDRESGALAALCQEMGVELLTLFGSARTCPDSAGDVDLAYGFARAGAADELGLANALGERYGDLLDLLPLDRAGEVARYAALGPAEVLVELQPGGFAERQIRAFRDYVDTQRFRDRALQVLAS